jgi:hypothetical protein
LANQATTNQPTNQQRTQPFQAGRGLQCLANALIMAATPAIVRVERAMCIDFVRTLNAPVAQALEEKRGAL